MLKHIINHVYVEVYYVVMNIAVLKAILIKP